MATTSEDARGAVKAASSSHAGPAYKRIADQIRGLILDGVLQPGERLPGEDELSANFGVSRNTVRESLRMLGSQSLVETTRGVAGGSFLAKPSAEVLQEQIESSFRLLYRSAHVSQDELLETRLAFELPCVRWAAERRSEADLQRIRDAVRRVEKGATALDRAAHGQEFHQSVLNASGNRYLSVVAPPVWRSFSKNAFERPVSAAVWREYDQAHQEIFEHVENRDPDLAAESMRRHLEHLRQTNR